MDSNRITYHIYCRMAGYIITIVMHVVNILVMRSYFTDEAMKDSTVKFFVDNQTRFFTGWTFILQIVYAVTGLTCDILTLQNAGNKKYKLPKHLRGFRDILFAGIQWPSCLLVSTFFWGVYNLDRRLIMPPVLDQVLTLRSNHVIHTAIVPVVLWELMFRPRTSLNEKSHMRNLAYLHIHFIIYFTVLFYTYYSQGKWIYPIFDHIYGTIFFPILLVFIGVTLQFFYYIQWPLTRLFWGHLEKKKLR